MLKLLSVIIVQLKSLYCGPINIIYILMLNSSEKNLGRKFVNVNSGSCVIILYTLSASPVLTLIKMI